MNWYDLDTVLARAGLPEVAQRLGMTLEQRGASIQVLCPFHQDTRPSMRFFAADGARPQHFHCFSCDAHGHAVDLVKQVQGIEFGPAVEWLARAFGVPPSRTASASNRLARSTREPALQFALKVFDQGHDEQRFVEWCANRSFERDFLYGLGLRYIGRAVLIPALESRGLGARVELIDGLLSLGLLVRLRPNAANDQLSLGLAEQFRDYFHDGRVLIPIRSLDGDVKGFSGRSVLDPLPEGIAKYLLNPGLSKADILFNADNARALLQADAKAGNSDKGKTLYIVEGFLDALRLQSLNLPAVALMGTSLSSEQLKTLATGERPLAKASESTAVRIFLDSDHPGFAGAARATRQLLGIPGLKLEWVATENDDVARIKKDPDDFLNGLTAVAARELLDKLSHPAVAAIVVAELGRNSAEVLADLAWQELSPYSRENALFKTMRAVRALSEGAADWTHRLSALPQPRPKWVESLQEFLSGSVAGQGGVRKQPTHLFLNDQEARLNHSRVLAYHGARRGELPCDEETWLSLDLGAKLFNSLAIERLHQPGWLLAAPFDAVHLPRKFTTDAKVLDDPRRKVMPQPADLHLQQFLMTELLSERNDFANQGNVVFSDCIPAVRWFRSERRITVTGVSPAGEPSPAPITDDEERTLSFGYQVDMDVLEGRRPPSDQGMFRPYGECWRDYMASLTRQAQAIGGQVHALRLDAQRYYDSIQRYVVRDRLQGAIERGCDIVGYDHFNTLLGLSADAETPAPEQLVNKLCESLFHYKFRNPNDGSVNRSEEARGIPQGPVLSAWIGTIAMFPVDAVARQFIRDHLCRVEDGSTRPRVGYARYVDDIVLFADSDALLSELREAIQVAAARLSLILLRKGNRIVPGSPEKVMLQLNEGRNFAASVPAWEPPLTADGESGWGLGGDAPELDRQCALRLLRHPSLLDDPLRVHERIRDAMRAPDLRPSDLGKCARLLWWQIAMGLVDDESSTRHDLWTRYNEKWDYVCTGHSWASEFKRRGYDVLFAVEGLDKLLDPDPWVESGQSGKRVAEHHQALRSIATEVKKTGFFDGIDPHENGNHVRRRVQIVQWKAHQHSPSDEDEQLPVSPQVDEKLSPIAWFSNAAKLLQSSGLDESDHPFRTLVHRGLDPAWQKAPVADNVRQWLMPTFDASGQQEASDSKAVNEANGARSLALDFLIALTPDRYRWSVLQKFPQLLGIETGRRLAVLPSLPTAQRMLAYEVDSSRIEPGRTRLYTFSHRADVLPQQTFLGATIAGRTATEAPPLAPTWGVAEQINDRLYRWQTEYGHAVAFFDGTAGIVNRAHFAATLFDALYVITKQLHQDGKELVPVVAQLVTNAQNRLNGSSTDEGRALYLLGEPIDVDKLGVTAWVRDGRGRLRSKNVPRAFAQCWRIGWAVTDAMGLIGDEDGSDSEDFTPSESPVEDFVLRQQLNKLRGKWISDAQVLRQESDGMPTTVRRSLNILRSFDRESTPAQQVELVLVTETETRSMALRLRQKDGAGLRTCLHSVPGLVLQRLPLKVLEQLELGRGDADTELRADLVLLLALARSLDARSNATDAPEKGAAEALRAGLSLAIAGTALRGAVASLWGLAREHGQGRLPERLSIPWQWEMPESGRQNPQRDYSAMRTWLLQDRWTALNDATPWQWMLALIGLLDGLWPKAFDNDSLRKVYDALRSWQCAPADKEEWAWPYDGLPIHAERTCQALLEAAPQAALDIDAMLQLVVQPVVSEAFRRHPTSDTFTDSSGSEWVLSKLQYTGLGSPESVARVQRGARRMATWTEVRRLADGELLSVHRVDDKLGRWFVGQAPKPNQVVAQVLAHETALGTREKDASGAADIAKPDSSSSRDLMQTGLGRTLDQGQPTDITNWQSSSWNARSAKSEAHLRVALFQWRIDETYGHSLAEVGIGGLGLPSWAKSALRKELIPDSDLARVDRVAHRGKESGWKQRCSVQSWPEHRRRRLLKRALESCSKFGVDLLVLPEVSVRPETVKWLADELHHHPGLAVLAGTYRALDPTDQSQHLRAPLTMLWHPKLELAGKLFPSCASRTLRFSRGKKYRAVAAKELFRPDWDTLAPLFTSERLLEQLELDGMTGVRSQQLLRAAIDELPPLRYCMELICSELFLMTSPANIPALRNEISALLKRFPASAANDARELVRADYEGLGEQLSIAHGLSTPRRSVLLVPAATTRSSDYWYAGQAGVLASGTATVFCNAVYSTLFCGGSCFIGMEATQASKDAAGVIGPLTPYHGWSKGIFLGGANGPLSKGDQAIVIVDLDPVHVVTGKPRPQVLPEPMSLVAYLPVVELLDAQENGAALKNALKDQFKATASEALNKVQTALTPNGVRRQDFWAAFESLLKHSRGASIIDGPDLDHYANLFSDPDAVRSRLLCWQNDRHQQPHPGHSENQLEPAWLDFLAVDLTLGAFQDLPAIDVPPWSSEAEPIEAA